MATETAYRSPKRKRDALEFELSPPASPTSTLSVASLPESRLREEEELGRYSPRTVVAGRLKDLVIQEESVDTDVPQSIQVVQWRSSSEPPADHTGLSAQIRQSHIRISPGGSPVRTTEQNSGEAIQHPSEQPSRTTKRSANRNPRNKLSTKSRKKNSSPPPPENDLPNSLTWSDSEITGYNPTDPNDDGYGINGIGFKPTAAIAWARSQKRQKQMTEWKIREAKEARERRRERREGASHINTITEDKAGGKTHKKVKFDLG